MPDRAELEALIRRVEALTGPYREVDEIIATTIGGYVYEKRGRDQKAWFYPEDGGWRRQKYGVQDGLPRYTASLDATVALVERCLPGWRHAYERRATGINLAWVSDDDEGPAMPSVGATPALSLLSALLRALSDKAKEEER